MTNEQCIEVAEKVWGMSPLDLAQLRFDKGRHAAPDSLEYIDNYRNKLVNSWTGFGRTVEAMAEKDFVLITHPTLNFCASGLDVYDGGRVHNDEPIEIIEATHLAALEAVKEK